MVYAHLFCGDFRLFQSCFLQANILGEADGKFETQVRNDTLEHFGIGESALEVGPMSKLNAYYEK